MKKSGGACWAGRSMTSKVAQGIGQWVFTLLSLGLVLGFPLVAQAHSSGPPRLSDAKAGPYRVFVWTQPEPLRVGDVHISVLVTVATTNNPTAQPVSDAQVNVRFVPLHQPDQAVVVTTTLQAFLNNLYHEADVHLPSPDLWRVIIDISGPLGKGNVQFESEVLPARVLNWWLIGGAGVLLVCLIGLIGTWSRWQSQTQASATQVHVTRKVRVESKLW